MLSIAKALLQQLGILLETLNKTSIKRLVIYLMLLYPMVLLYMYKDELKFMFVTNTAGNVVIENIADAQARCYKLRMTYRAEAILIYLYQPATKDKNYKELTVFSTGLLFTPLSSSKTVTLSSQSKVLEDLKRDNASIITATSEYNEAAIVQAFNLSSMIITPIRDLSSDQIIGEVIWIFYETNLTDVNTLRQAGQIFSYNINNNQ